MDALEVIAVVGGVGFLVWILWKFGDVGAAIDGLIEGIVDGLTE
jgi:hypothetical protein